MIGTWRQQQAQQNMLDHLAAEPQGRSEEEVISDAARAAVEIATTVKITQDALDVFEAHTDLHDGAVAFLKELGFEVIG